MNFQTTDLIVESAAKKKVAKKKCVKKTCAKPPRTCCRQTCKKTSGGPSTCKRPSSLCGGSCTQAQAADIAAEVARLQGMVGKLVKTLKKPEKELELN